MRRNLFVGMPNDKLEESYNSYIRFICKRENFQKELFADLVIEYQSFIESNHPKAAEALCRTDMFHEIARRYFKIVDMCKDKDFCELFGIT